MKIEICANSIESAVAAQKAGANRIELCSALSLGGLTPSLGLIMQVKKAVSIPVHVLIRPRPGNFMYSQDEIDIMKFDIKMCNARGLDGIVVGALDKDYNIDVEAMIQFMREAIDMEITFHRAFDLLAHPKRELEIIKTMELQRVLTSGQQKKAIDGLDLLEELKKIAGKKVEIMPGSGISIENVEVFKKAGFSSVHLSASGESETTVASMTNVHFGTREPMANENLIKKVVAVAKG